MSEDEVVPKKTNVFYDKKALKLMIQNLNFGTVVEVTESECTILTTSWFGDRPAENLLRVDVTLSKYSFSVGRVGNIVIHTESLLDRASAILSDMTISEKIDFNEAGACSVTMYRNATPESVDRLFTVSVSEDFTKLSIEGLSSDNFYAYSADVTE